MKCCRLMRRGRGAVWVRVRCGGARVVRTRSVNAFPKALRSAVDVNLVHLLHCDATTIPPTAMDSSHGFPTSGISRVKHPQH